MIFKNQNEAAKLLADKIRNELNPTKTNSLLGFINPDSQQFSQTVSKNLGLNLEFLPKLLISNTNTNVLYFIIIDSGETRGQEYNEYTDILHKKHPNAQIIIAAPVIPQSEESMLKDCSDRLLTLHVESLFFSMSQFFQK